MTLDLGPGLQVFERGWLSSNNILLDDGDGAALVDSGHLVHAPQTVALLRQQLGDRPLRRLINTHLHSDHCGGNAAVQREWRLQLQVPSGSWRAVQDWDEQALSYRPTGQRCERFSAQGSISAGEVLRIGARDWQVLGAPGHDPQSVMLFDAEHGVLISADALWENGFGVVFPELEGEAAFDDVQSVLDLIESLPVRCVIPGHGAAFGDVGARAAARALAPGRLSRRPGEAPAPRRQGADQVPPDGRAPAGPAGAARLDARHAAAAVHLGRTGPPRRQPCGLGRPAAAGAAGQRRAPAARRRGARRLTRPAREQMQRARDAAIHHAQVPASGGTVMPAPCGRPKMRLSCHQPV